MKNMDESYSSVCTQPIDRVTLADYWVAELKGPDEEAVEEHLLSCDDCGARLREIVALAEGVRDLARKGSLRMILNEAILERAAADGLRIRQYAVPPGGAVQCTVTAKDQLLIGRLAAHLAGARRVDLSFCDEMGAEQFRLPDIPVQAQSPEVIYQEAIEFAKVLPTTRMIARLVTFDQSGSEQLLGEYTFNHTRTLPGPGAW